MDFVEGDKVKLVNPGRNKEIGKVVDIEIKGKTKRYIVQFPTCGIDWYLSKEIKKVKIDKK